MIPINQYPYTDVHEFNLDYVLQQLASIIAQLEDLEARVTVLEEQNNP